eukprot:CAMPEP_0206238080 /NCGR_PEP_ID=MMETSP0047_2-20121206/14620_1 /ASSEMBLY_ACC=CAM_ASM_000192 /TAXON_ID=195065 /ORGANISM="Chroomonas mesostigmatica_cf, Strain CCMP1168" /LENGTH=132 /DNA_ID=CAMNT_0053662583 /DNA_START=210 /DNA_END=609 /DNA_ORIENTATION=-
MQSHPNGPQCATKCTKPPPPPDGGAPLKKTCDLSLGRARQGASAPIPAWAEGAQLGQGASTPSQLVADGVDGALLDLQLAEHALQLHLGQRLEALERPLLVVKVRGHPVRVLLRVERRGDGLVELRVLALHR